MDTKTATTVLAREEWGSSYSISCGESPIRDWTTFIEGVGYFGVVQYKSSGYPLLLSKHVDVPIVMAVLLIASFAMIASIAIIRRGRQSA